MNMARVDIIAGGLLCAFGIAIIVAAPLTVGEYNEVGLTPWSFPQALSAAIAMLSALLCWNGWRNRRREVADLETDGASSTPHIIAAIVVMGLYIVGMPLFGYLAATACTLLVLSIIYGNRRWLGLFFVAAAAPPALYFFFQEVMIILLPEASLF
ncbi:MAG: tripartite tricarboxylate transporter TctB family protein [Alphaproteobacteria bacterium]